MKHSLTPLFLISLLISLLFGLTVANPRQAEAQELADFPVQVVLTVPMPPTPVKANGKLHLFYELHIANLSNESLTLKRLDVLGEAASTDPIVTYQEAELTDRLLRWGVWPDLSESLVISAGMNAVLYQQLIVEPANLPTGLRHRLFLTSTDPFGKRSERVVEDERISVRRTAPVVIDAPLRGAGWLAAAGMSNRAGHRRELMQAHGRMQAAQRFAIDWLQIGADGQPFHDDPALNANWYGYGAEILAVADGVVVDVKDGIPENVPLIGTFAVSITWETIGGNYVIVDQGNRHFAFYAHLQPQSLRVNVGDKVKQGQVLALLGNSGNSDAPHLHLHMTNANSPLGAEGIPYVFKSFEVQGMVPSLDVFESGKGWQPEGPAEQRKLEIPLEYTVVRFP